MQFFFAVTQLSAFTGLVIGQQLLISYLSSEMTSALSHPSDTVSVSLERLQQLEACEAQADVQKRHIELLQKQITESDAALKLEQARGEKHAEALMHIARTCDERTSEMKEQHAAALRVKDMITGKVEDENAALKEKLVELASSHAAAISKQEAQHKGAIIKLEAENAALRAQAASTLTEIHAAVTTGAMEILPVRPSDSRQFVEWRVGGIPTVPPPPVVELPLVPQFDRAWCAAMCVNGWNVDVDAAAGGVRAKATGGGDSSCTLRSAVPLPRLGPSLGAAARHRPAYRVIVEEYSAHGYCRLGFVPSHHVHGGGVAAAVAPTPTYPICNYGGWYILVYASRPGDVPRNTKYSGWTVMAPADSAYATTAEVPPVPAGGAVEFAVDYAAGTCLMAFYPPAAVAGGFVQAPHAKMELRFIATAAGATVLGLPLPARTVPTAADSGVALYPAVEAFGSGIAWRFVAV
jgi:hypothetical protein